MGWVLLDGIFVVWRKKGRAHSIHGGASKISGSRVRKDLWDREKILCLDRIWGGVGGENLFRMWEKGSLLLKMIQNQHKAGVMWSRGRDFEVPWWAAHMRLGDLDLEKNDSTSCHGKSDWDSDHKTHRRGIWWKCCWRSKKKRCMTMKNFGIQMNDRHDHGSCSGIRPKIKTYRERWHVGRDWWIF